MNRSKHTPGPWRVGESPEMHVWADGTPRIAIVPLRDVSIVEQKANARLIGAAPTIYENGVALLAFLEPDSLKDQASDPQLRRAALDALIAFRASIEAVAADG